MKIFVIIGLFILFIILWRFVSMKQNEKFTDMDMMKYLKELTNTKHENDIFDNAIVYMNDDWNGFGDSGGRMGFDKCISDCKGNCVELGVTGDSVCFNPLEFTKDYNVTSLKNV